MSGFADELFDESIGTSSKKWALMLFAAIAGAAAALWLTGRARSQGSDQAPAEVETAAAGDLSPTAVSADTSAIGSMKARISRTPAVSMLRQHLAGGGEAPAESAEQPD